MLKFFCLFVFCFFFTIFKYFILFFLLLSTATTVIKMLFLSILLGFKFSFFNNRLLLFSKTLVCLSVCLSLSQRAQHEAINLIFLLGLNNTLRPFPIPFFLPPLFEKKIPKTRAFSCLIIFHNYTPSPLLSALTCCHSPRCDFTKDGSDLKMQSTE